MDSKLEPHGPVLPHRFPVVRKCRCTRKPLSRHRKNLDDSLPFTERVSHIGYPRLSHEIIVMALSDPFRGKVLVMANSAALLRANLP
jgi:hypothetical protein